VSRTLSCAHWAYIRITTGSCSASAPTWPKSTGSHRSKICARRSRRSNSSLRPATAWLERGNVDISKADFVEVPLASMFAALTSKCVSAITLYVNAHYDDLLPMISTFSGLPTETLAKMPKPVVPTTMRSVILQPVIDSAVHFKAIAAPFKAQDVILPGAP
jgi:hypothetical protein